MLCIPHPHGRCSKQREGPGDGSEPRRRVLGLILCWRRPLPACEAQSQLDHLQRNLGRQLLPPVPMGKLLPHRLTTAQGRAPGPRVGLCPVSAVPQTCPLLLGAWPPSSGCLPRGHLNVAPAPGPFKGPCGHRRRSQGVAKRLSGQVGGSAAGASCAVWTGAHTPFRTQPAAPSQRQAEAVCGTLCWSLPLSTLPDGSPPL